MDIFPGGDYHFPITPPSSGRSVTDAEKEQLKKRVKELEQELKEKENKPVNGTIWFGNHKDKAIVNRFVDFFKTYIWRF